MSAFTEKQIREFFYDKNFSFQGNAYFPKLLKAEPNQSGTRNIYSCQVAFFTDVNQIPQDLSPEDRDYAMKAVVKNQQSLQMLNQFMMEAKQKFWPDFPMQAFINPVKHYDSYLRQDGKANPEFCKGKYWVNASSGESRQPAIVDTNRQVILDPSVIFSGMNAIMSIGLYPILKNKTGISANINAVMVLGGGTPTATGAGPVDVNSVFGDFANDMGGNVGHNAGSNLGDAFGQNVQQTQQQNVQQTQQQNVQQNVQQTQQHFDPSQQQHTGAGQYNPNGGNNNSNGNGFV